MALILLFHMTISDAALAAGMGKESGVTAPGADYMRDQPITEEMQGEIPLMEEGEVEPGEVKGLSELEGPGERNETGSRLAKRAELQGSKKAEANKESVHSELTEEEVIPESYDPRAGAILPPLRNQNPTGLCWTFGSLGCMEMNLIKKGIAGKNVDLSERHLAYYFFKKGNLSDPVGYSKGDYNSVTAAGDEDAYINCGGNNYLTIWHLASWIGAVSENSAPFSSLSANTAVDRNGLMGQPESLQAAYGDDVAHLQNAYVLRIAKSYKDESLRKKMQGLILKYGAIGTGYRSMSDSTYGNAQHDCYYYDGSNYTTNHNILIVGWDDNFPKEYFRSSHRPKENGAWLVRNSWGEEQEDGVQSGYFWLSYQDHGLQEAAGSSVYQYAFVFDTEKADNYDHLYQYDGNANYRHYIYRTESAAAIYRARADEGEVLSAVGIGVKSEGADYTLQIYTGVTGNDPESGTLRLTQSGSLDYSGYHTIVLDREIPLTNGEQYSVVFSDLTDKASTTQPKGAPLLHAACSEKMQAKKSGSITYYWEFYSDASRDKTFVKSGQDSNWVNANELCCGDYYTEKDGVRSLVKNEYFMRSAVGEENIDQLTKSNYSLRIKAYTKGGIISSNEIPADEQEESSGNGNGGSEEKPEEGKEEQGGKVPGKEEGKLVGLTLNETAVQAKRQDTIQLTASPVFSEGRRDLPVTWESSDPSVATVTDFGRVTVCGYGKATISCRIENLAAECEILVPPVTTEVSVKAAGKTVKNAKLVLQYKQAKGADGYLLLRSKKSKQGYQICKTMESSLEGSIKAAALGKDNKAYFYQVVPYVQDQSGKVYTAEGERTAYSLLPVYKLKKISKGKNGALTIRWKEDNGVIAAMQPAGCRITYRKNKSKKYSFLKNVSCKKKQKTITVTVKKKDAKKGIYRIQAYGKLKGRKFYSVGRVATFK